MESSSGKIFAQMRITRGVTARTDAQKQVDTRVGALFYILINNPFDTDTMAQQMFVSDSCGLYSTTYTASSACSGVKGTLMLSHSYPLPGGERGTELQRKKV
jgi:hypothetical protein